MSSKENGNITEKVRKCENQKYKSKNAVNH